MAYQDYIRKRQELMRKTKQQQQMQDYRDNQKKYDLYNNAQKGMNNAVGLYNSGDKLQAGGKNLNKFGDKMLQKDSELAHKVGDFSKNLGDKMTGAGNKINTFLGKGAATGATNGASTGAVGNAIGAEVAGTGAGAGVGSGSAVGSAIGAQTGGAALGSGAGALGTGAGSSALGSAIAAETGGAALGTGAAGLGTAGATTAGLGAGTAGAAGLGAGAAGAGTAAAGTGAAAGAAGAGAAGGAAATGAMAALGPIGLGIAAAMMIGSLIKGAKAKRDAKAMAKAQAASQEAIANKKQQNANIMQEGMENQNEMKQKMADIQANMNPSTDTTGYAGTLPEIANYQNNAEQKAQINDNYGTRDPVYSELQFFKNNPNVGGYANFDENKIIHNPLNGFSPEQREGIRQNEGTRLFINNHPLFAPKEELTPYQKMNLGNYSDNEQDVKNTVAGRYMAGDQSIGQVSPEQKEELDNLKFTKNLYEKYSNQGENNMQPQEDNAGLVSKLMGLIGGQTVGGAAQVTPDGNPITGPALDPNAGVAQAQQPNMFENIMNKVKGFNLGEGLRDMNAGYQDNVKTSFTEGDLYNRMSGGKLPDESVGETEVIEPQEGQNIEAGAAQNDPKVNNIMSRIGELAGTAQRTLSRPMVQGAIASGISAANGNDIGSALEYGFNWGKDKAMSDRYRQMIDPDAAPSLLGGYTSTDYNSYLNKIKQDNDLKEREYQHSEDTKDRQERKEERDRKQANEDRNFYAGRADKAREQANWEREAKAREEGKWGSSYSRSNSSTGESFKDLKEQFEWYRDNGDMEKALEIKQKIIALGAKKEPKLLY